VWYLIPAVLLLGRRRRSMAMLCPVVHPAKKASYRYERYREAWSLLTWSRAELAQCNAPPPPPSHHRKPNSRTATKARRENLCSTVEERPFRAAKTSPLTNLGFSR